MAWLWTDDVNLKKLLNIPGSLPAQYLNIKIPVRYCRISANLRNFNWENKDDEWQNGFEKVSFV